MRKVESINQAQKTSRKPVSSNKPQANKAPVDSHGTFPSTEMPLTAQIAEFNKMHLKNPKKAVQFQGGESHKDLLALHASLEKEKPWYGFGEKHKEIKRLQNRIELKLKDSPDPHLHAIKNNRSKILEHFKNSEPNQIWADITTPSNEAFSQHNDITALKIAKDTLGFWNFAAVKAIKERIKQLEPQQGKSTKSNPTYNKTKPYQNEYDRALKNNPRDML